MLLFIVPSSARSSVPSQPASRPVAIAMLFNVSAVPFSMNIGTTRARGPIA